MNKDTSEIVKLTERISKDPKSKLFVPLAEEYKKAGQIEMSIQVLQDGLRNNPAYVTARSFLGRLLIETGDLPAAQKEFEEVVKAIPDNLMAHRKLGDIYAYQGRPAEAVSQYKTVVSLNPKDAEAAMLIAEAEAGRDIKKHLPALKAVAAGEPQKKQEPAGSSPAQSSGKPQPQPTAAKQQEPVHAAPVAEEEEAEEVLLVEPLDVPAAPESGSLEQELAASNLGFLAETPDSSVAEGRQEEQKGDLFADGDPFAVGGEAPVTTGESAAEIIEEPQEQVPEAVSSPEKQQAADDFTTDTLAELYISQGFYEKAIDIYERMLADKPNSQGLKDKLQKVRAMAAASDHETDSQAASLKMPAGLDPDFATKEPAPETGSDVEAFASPAGDQPGPAPVLDEEIPAPVHPAPVKHFDVGFQPREYVPPDAVPRASKKSTAEVRDRGAGQPSVNQAGEQKTSPARKSAESKKEKIERLEGWLKNIKKET